MLRWARERLSPSPMASLDSHLLLGHAIGRERSWLMAHADEPIAVAAASHYAHLIARRETGVPVAYLRGHCEWFGMTLRITPHVLVPRPETELLVEEALTIARRRQAKNVVDVGTGSGAIAIQLARSLSSAGITGIDVSGEALQVALHNAESMRTSDRISWLQGNLLEPITSEPDLVVANLPYLSASMMSEIGPDVRHEPALALFGGPTGLELYRELFEQRQARAWSMPVVLEIDARQATELSTMLRNVFSETNVRVSQDYAGHDRIAVVGA